MNLMEYIVAKGKKRDGFPIEPDRDEIIYWLERNGYDHVIYQTAHDDEDLAYHNIRTGNNCYTYAGYGPKGLRDPFIKILHNDRIFSIYLYTETKSKPSFYESIHEVYNGRTYPNEISHKKVTYEYIRSFLSR